MKTRKYLVRQALTLVLAMAMPIVAFAQQETQTENQAEKTLETLMIEMATKPEQHQALANYYKEKADMARQELEQHRAMKQAYTGYRKNEKAKESMLKHCDRLISMDEEAAKAYDQLAKDHEQAAKTS